MWWCNDARAGHTGFGTELIDGCGNFGCQVFRETPSACTAKPCSAPHLREADRVWVAFPAFTPAAPGGPPVRAARRNAGFRPILHRMALRPCGETVVAASVLLAFDADGWTFVASGRSLPRVRPKRTNGGDASHATEPGRLQEASGVPSQRCAARVSQDPRHLTPLLYSGRGFAINWNLPNMIGSAPASPRIAGSGFALVASRHQCPIIEIEHHVG